MTPNHTGSCMVPCVDTFLVSILLLIGIATVQYSHTPGQYNALSRVNHPQQTLIHSL